MARFVSGDVVVVPFPFTDLASAKIRPALVLAALTRGDLILCQITSQAAGHPEAVLILEEMLGRRIEMLAWLWNRLRPQSATSNGAWPRRLV